MVMPDPYLKMPPMDRQFPFLVIQIFFCCKPFVFDADKNLDGCETKLFMKDPI